MTTGELPPRLQQELQSALGRERDQLRESLEWLADAVRTLSESQGEESGAGGGAADVASDLAEQAVDLALERAEMERLAEVEEALRRIEAGDYGYCDTCGSPIDVERLRAVPWTRYCIHCAERAARGRPLRKPSEVV